MFKGCSSSLVVVIGCLAGLAALFGWLEPKLVAVFDIPAPRKTALKDGNFEVKPVNWRARWRAFRKKDLCVEIGGFPPVPANKRQTFDTDGNRQWVFELKEWSGSDLEAKVYDVTFGFCDGTFFPQKTKLRLTTLEAGIAIGSLDGKTKLQGRAITQADNPVRILVTLLGTSIEQTQELQVLQGVEDGEVFYYFKWEVEKIPIYHPEDPKYDDPFLKIEVLDSSGTTISKMEPYAKLIAPGVSIDSFAPFSRVLVQAMQNDQGDFKADFVLKPDRKLIETIDGKPAIDLKVTAATEGLKLAWPKAPEGPVMSTIYRDERQLASTFDQSYVDKQGLPSSSYRVEQPFNDGIRVSPAVAVELAGDNSVGEMPSQPPIQQSIKLLFFDLEVAKHIIVLVGFSAVLVWWFLKDLQVARPLHQVSAKLWASLGSTLAWALLHRFRKNTKEKISQRIEESGVQPETFQSSPDWILSELQARPIIIRKRIKNPFEAFRVVFALIGQTRFLARPRVDGVLLVLSNKLVVDPGFELANALDHGVFRFRPLRNKILEDARLVAVIVGFGVEAINTTSLPRNSSVFLLQIEMKKAKSVPDSD